jgi:hypothetical protein
MAGDWLKIEKDTPEKPEVLALSARLGVSRADAFLACFVFWRWADAQTPDGSAPLVTPTMIDTMIGLPGFSHALSEVGWLRLRSGGVELPHFGRHMGQSAKRRVDAAERQRASRARDGPPAVTLLSQNSVTREEKRREEMKAPPQPPLGRGGAPHSNGNHTGTDPPGDSLPARALAELWCSVSTRRKRGRPCDRPEDLAPDVAELLRRGIPEAKVRDAILADRDHGEHWWQFRDRLTRKPARQPAAMEKSTEDITREMVRRREESARLAQQAKAAAARRSPGRGEG